VLDQAFIDARRADLQQQLDGLRREIEGQGADPDADEVAFADDAGFSDRSHSTEERSRLIALVRALAKIESGTYGICERCGQPIAPERLEALPWATLCIDCKQKGLSA
jgi:RNA polymerase-binding protein DksA